MKKKKDITEKINTVRGFKGSEIYCNIVKVSASGMTRKMKFYSIKENRLINITDEFAAICDYTMDKDYNLIVPGCGMDMVFSVITSLNKRIALLDNISTHDTYSTYIFNANEYKII